MNIKITGRNKELFQENLKNILNVATVVAGTGTIPDEYDIENAETRGRYFVREKKKFTILGSSNNNWAHILEEGENYIIIDFLTRYEKPNCEKVNSLSNLILTWFDDCTELVE
jgi:hypothetical protein